MTINRAIAKTSNGFSHDEKLITLNAVRTLKTDDATTENVIKAVTESNPEIQPERVRNILTHLLRKEVVVKKRKNSRRFVWDTKDNI